MTDLNKMEYFFTYKSFVKEKWTKRAIIDVLSEEFSIRSRDYYIEALKNGVITIDNKIVEPYYKLKHGNVLRHIVHQHEPKQPNIKIIYQDEELTVLNKPAGIPCHPVGPYHYYTVTKTVFGDNKVGCINRLDMPVSGVLLINTNNSKKLHEDLNSAKKIYVAKVKGEFPEHIEIEEPIGHGDGKIMKITKDGKPSKTIFDLLEYKNGFSLVKCQPITGRTHQIRVHIKYAGFPIINDVIYGEGKNEKEIFPYDCNADVSELPENHKFIVKNCTGSNNRSFVIKNSFICLHAWKYEFNNKTYEAEWPEWTKLN